MCFSSTSPQSVNISKVEGGFVSEPVGGKRAPLPPYLSSHRPGCQHVAAEVELARLHLVIAGAAVVGHGLDVRRTLEHLDVMHDGLVARSYHRLVLAGGETGGGRNTQERAGGVRLGRTHTHTHTLGLGLKLPHTHSFFPILREDYYHDDVVLGHVLRQRLNEAPVGGLLTRYDHLGGPDFKRLHVWRQRGRRRVGPQHQHSLHARVDAGQVELLRRGKRPIQESVDDVHGSLLGERETA